jgi:hypothetical protein
LCALQDFKFGVSSAASENVKVSVYADRQKCQIHTIFKAVLHTALHSTARESQHYRTKALQKTIVQTVV